MSFMQFCPRFVEEWLRVDTGQTDRRKGGWMERQIGYYIYAHTSGIRKKSVKTLTVNTNLSKGRQQISSQG